MQSFHEAKCIDFVNPLCGLVYVALLTACATPPPACVPARDDHGRIARSRAVIAEFKRLHPCPSTGMATGACPGYVIDHIVALACCGADRPENLQYQTVADAKAKDRWELMCGR